MMIEKIRNFLNNRYNINEYPALDQQFIIWNRTKPLAGVRILDGTPVFTNTLLKYINLLAAGAELTVGYSENIPYDPSVVNFLALISTKQALSVRDTAVRTKSVHLGASHMTSSQKTTVA